MIRVFLRSRGTRSALVLAVFAGIYTAGALMLHVEVLGIELPVLEAVLAVSASFLLGMRLNLAFDRWWEGRNICTAIRNTTREALIGTCSQKATLTPGSGRSKG